MCKMYRINLTLEEINAINNLIYIGSALAEMIYLHFSFSTAGARYYHEWAKALNIAHPALHWQLPKNLPKLTGNSPDG